MSPQVASVGLLLWHKFLIYKSMNNFSIQTKGVDTHIYIERSSGESFVFYENVKLTIIIAELK